MAIEYGSSPPAQGRLNAARGGRPGSASQPDREVGEDLERPLVAEEPALGDDHLLHQRLEFVPGGEQRLFVLGLRAEAQAGHPDVDPSGDQPEPDRLRIEPDPLGQESLDHAQRRPAHAGTSIARPSRILPGSTSCKRPSSAS